MGLFRVFLLESYKWIGLGWMGWDWDLCVGLLYEHRFAVLKMANVGKNSHFLTQILTKPKKTFFGRICPRAFLGIPNWPNIFLKAQFF